MTQILNVAVIAYFFLFFGSAGFIAYHDPARFRRLMWIGYAAFWRSLGRALGWAVALGLAYLAWRVWG